MAAVRAKFFVSEVAHRAFNPNYAQVTLAPVSRGDGNARWAAATPGGQIQLTINNPDAAKVFADALGEEFYIDFTPAAKHDSPADGHAFRAGEFPEGHYSHGKDVCGECAQSEAAHGPRND